jgi:hypothetical protein
VGLTSCAHAKSFVPLCIASSYFISVDTCEVEGGHQADSRGGGAEGGKERRRHRLESGGRTAAKQQAAMGGSAEEGGGLESKRDDEDVACAVRGIELCLRVGEASTSLDGGEGAERGDGWRARFDASQHIRTVNKCSNLFDN